MSAWKTNRKTRKCFPVVEGPAIIVHEYEEIDNSENNLPEVYPSEDIDPDVKKYLRYPKEKKKERDYDFIDDDYPDDKLGDI